MPIGKKGGDLQFEIKIEMKMLVKGESIVTDRRITENIEETTMIGKLKDRFRRD